MESKQVVLVVDDHPQNIELLEAHLVPLGYAVIKAVSGEEALEKVAGNHIDLVLLDVLMPGMDGFETCRRLKKTADYLPVIMLTSLDGRDSRIKGIESGADDFLTKPFDSIELKLKIKNILKTKQLYENTEKYSREIKALSELKDNLTSFIVHDLRNPLACIIGFLDILLKSEDIKENDMDNVKNARESANTMAGMISDLLNMAKMENNEMEINGEDCELGEIISSAIGVMASPLNEKGIHLFNKATGTGVRVKVQKNLIERVAQNLLSNAIRYTPKEGNITIESAPDERSGFVEVLISDSGTGIPKEFQQSIFDKYATVEPKNKRMRGSTGLGLAFCKLTVELHGGKIWVTDRDGGGSIFHFTLPLSVKTGA